MKNIFSGLKFVIFTLIAFIVGTFPKASRLALAQSIYQNCYCSMRYVQKYSNNKNGEHSPSFWRIFKLDDQRDSLKSDNFDEN